MQKQFVQGDIFFELVDSIQGTKSPVAPESGKYVIARGEKTGHAHVMDVADGVLIRNTPNYPEKSHLFLVVNNKALVQHDEHMPLELDKGIYKVTQQRTFDYKKAQEEKVVD